jgi:3-isopropylmalate/(R)-2-methylmalate dehydratase small subunit
MEKFTTLTSTAVSLAIEDIDTDQIIPARFLKATTREGFGENLFRDWRYLPGDVPNPDFVLNDDTYQGQILVAGKNFGMGSSREHAAWALYDYGFRVVISSFFADIFRGNALNNGLLPLQIDNDLLLRLQAAIEENPELTLEVDLPQQTLTIPSLDVEVTFEVDPYKKTCLINGYDDIDFLRSKADVIAAYETKRPVAVQ